MFRRLLFVLASAPLALLFLASDAIAPEARAASSSAAKVQVHECSLAAHSGDAHRPRSAKPDNPGGGNGNGNGNGGGGKDKGGDKVCAKTYSQWNVSNIDVYVNDSGRPSTIAAGVLASYAQKAVDEWSCYSGLGDSVTVTFVGSASGAEITIDWGNLGSSGTLGQAATSYGSGGITDSDVTMNSNQSSFSWTAGPTPSVDSDGCAVEVANGNTSSSNYDLLSVLGHEIGHALGIAHPTKRCSSKDACYPESMYSCTDAEEFERRALNAGDKAAIESLYGADQ